MLLSEGRSKLEASVTPQGSEAEAQRGDGARDAFSAGNRQETQIPPLLLGSGEALGSGQGMRLPGLLLPDSFF